MRVGSVTRIGHQDSRIGRHGSVTGNHGSVTNLNGSVARSPGSVTGGIAKESETNEADHTGSVATNKLANLHAGLQCTLASSTSPACSYSGCPGMANKPDRYSEGTENTPNQPPERSSEGKENVPNQPYRIGRRDRSPPRSSKGKENKPNQPYRIGRQDRSPERPQEKKKKQSNHTGSYNVTIPESRHFPKIS